ncbi:MAG: hypothetical protein BroJett040_17680 [Oligoflexia bacterium]|nr:MAG: hypothetical protein BroJett040_17680 [Oligoflexia bacterium]
MLKFKLMIIIVAVVVVVGDFALAQDAKAKKDPRKQTLSFEDELVEGATQKPELFYLFQKKNFNYKRLVKLRENFIPELRRTSEDIQRSRSGN